uniref:Hexosyltransferase n=1 Tax=Phallusia mammillata TaxID=59560 RepID=A0A6F9DGL3_9ASCI|nr:uncharacterized protein LOC100180747 [Phallusia mammillata]
MVLFIPVCLNVLCTVMNLLTKIRLAIVFLICTMSSFIYWMQMAHLLGSQRVGVLELQQLRNRRTVNASSALVKLHDRLTYDFDEKLIGYNFVRPTFQFLLEPRNLHTQNCVDDRCKQMHSNVSWCMVNFVKSKASHQEHRNDIRRTWAHKLYLNGSRMETVFIVGMSRNVTTEMLLRQEHEMYGDILQYDGPDDYKYVPLKTMAGMQWAVDNLPSNHYYSSGDDDVMVVVERLKNIMDFYINITEFEDWAEFPIICTYRTMEFARPYRNSTGRYKQWYIAESEYKWPFYPRGCFGGFYSTSIRVVKQLLAAARTTPYLRVDDVWITGVLRVKLGMPDNMVIEPPEKIAFHGVGQLVSKLAAKEKAKNGTTKAKNGTVKAGKVKYFAIKPNTEM